MILMEAVSLAVAYLHKDSSLPVPIRSALLWDLAKDNLRKHIAGD
jgi:hypothetical protein